MGIDLFILSVVVFLLEYRTVNFTNHNAIVKMADDSLKFISVKLTKTWIITTYKWGWKQRKVWKLTRKFLCYDNVAR